MQSNLHLIVDDISIALKMRLQSLFGELLTKCDEYDTTNDIILSLPIVKKMLNSTSMHTTVDSDGLNDCVFIKKEKADPIKQTCTFNYDSLIGFIPPKIDEDEDEDEHVEDGADVCAIDNTQTIKDEPHETIDLSLIPPADVDEDEEEEETGDCDKCNGQITFSKEGYYVLTKDEDEVCWCQSCFETGWKQMYKDGWECDAYDHLEEDDPELAEPPEPLRNAEVNISLNIEEVEEDAADGEEEDEEEGEEEASDEEEDEEEDEDEGEEDGEEDEEADVQGAAAVDAAVDAVVEQDGEEEEDEVVTEEEEEEAVTEDGEDGEEEEAVTDDGEEEDEEVFEVEIMGKNYYTNNISTGDIYAIDSAGDPGDQVGQYINGIPTFIR
jgi:segregation and condensation protein B